MQWVTVPLEPTPAMLVAMWDHREAMRGQSENRIARAGYAAMIASRPSAPTAVEPDERYALIDEIGEWVRNNYQDYATINGLCSAMACTFYARASKGTK